VLIVIRLQLNLIDRQGASQPGGFDEQVANRSLFLAVVVLGGRFECCKSIIFRDLDLTQKGLVSELDNIKIGELPLPSKLTIDLIITDPRVALGQGVEPGVVRK